MILISVSSCCAAHAVHTSRATNQLCLWSWLHHSRWNWRRCLSVSTGTRAGAPAGPLPQLPEASALQLPVLHQGLRQAQPAGETQQDPHRSEVVWGRFSVLLWILDLIPGEVVDSSSSVSCVRRPLQKTSVVFKSLACHFECELLSYFTQTPCIMSVLCCWITYLAGK